MNQPQQAQKDMAAQPASNSQTPDISIDVTLAGKKKRTNSTNNSPPLSKEPSAATKKKKGGAHSGDKAGSVPDNIANTPVDGAAANTNPPEKAPQQPRHTKEEMVAVHAEAAAKKKQKEDLAKEKQCKILKLNHKEDAPFVN